MPHDFHHNYDVYFSQQRDNAHRSVLPFIDAYRYVVPATRVIEIGCGTGGVLRAFADRGAHVTGIDLDPTKIDYARQRFGDEIKAGSADLQAGNIYNIDLDRLGGAFDLVVMKDTIEHIHDQRRLMTMIPALLKRCGSAFFAFPPWHMPFGGHQQACDHRILMRTPWVHLLPRNLYKAVLQRCGEQADTVDALLETKETGISIGRFERLLSESGQDVLCRTFYLVNPIYEYRYGWRARRQLGLISRLPVLRDFVTTSAYYLTSPNPDDTSAS